MRNPILFITASLERYEQLAAAIAKSLAASTTHASNAVAAIGELRHPLSLVVVDSSLCECNVDATELILAHARNVPVLEMSFDSSERILRHVRTIFARRDRESAQAVRVAKQIVQADLRCTLSGLLLRSELMLEQVPSEHKRPFLELIDMAVSMREQLRR